MLHDTKASIKEEHCPYWAVLLFMSLLLFICSRQGRPVPSGGDGVQLVLEEPDMGVDVVGVVYEAHDFHNLQDGKEAENVVK